MGVLQRRWSYDSFLNHEEASRIFVLYRFRPLAQCNVHCFILHSDFLPGRSGHLPHHEWCISPTKHSVPVIWCHCCRRNWYVLRHLCLPPRLPPFQETENQKTNILALFQSPELATSPPSPSSAAPCVPSLAAYSPPSISAYLPVNGSDIRSSSALEWGSRCRCL